MVTVLVVIPSWAVIIVVINVAPTVNAMLWDGVPDATAWPFTVIVAVVSLAVGFTCRLLMLLGTVVVKFR